MRKVIKKSLFTLLPILALVLSIYTLRSQLLNIEVYAQNRNDCVSYGDYGAGYNGTPGSISIGSGCNYTVAKFTGPTCPTTQNYIGGGPTSGPMTLRPNPAPGTCEQDDFQGNPGGGGVCKCAGGGGGGGGNPPPPNTNCGGGGCSCGSACGSDSDCRNPASSGATVKCIAGRCANVVCPNDTETGSICACKNTFVKQCGQQCGLSVGLCGDAACAYLTGPICGSDGTGDYDQARFCIPTGGIPSNVLRNGYQIKPCANIEGAFYLADANGTSNLPRSAAVTFCQTPVSCGDALCTSGEVCEKSAAGAPTSRLCTASDIGKPPTGALTADCSFAAGANACKVVAPPLVCLNITKDTPTPKMGDQVRFTCGSIQGVDSYEFRYRIGTGAYLTLNASAAGSNVSAPVTITSPGTFDAQCRPCKAGTCTAYPN